VGRGGEVGQNTPKKGFPERKLSGVGRGGSNLDQRERGGGGENRREGRKKNVLVAAKKRGIVLSYYN